MSNTPRIGLIGLDTSHVLNFTQILNENKIPGAKVVAAFPGGSDDFELSHSRVEGFTKQLREQFGVKMLDSPQAVAEQVDMVFITTVDGRVHRRLFEQTIPYGRPTFIDKPFATSLADAQAMVDLAEKHQVPLMSCSSLRYTENFVAALAPNQDQGQLVGCDVFGPMAIEPTQPGLFWYGIHSVEMMVAAMGTGCRRVQATTNDDVDVITFEWDDGRVATIRGQRSGHSQFGVMLHREKGFQFVDIQAAGKSFFASMLEVIMQCLPAGRSDVPTQEMLEVMRVIEAANKSRETGEIIEVDAGVLV